MSLHNTDEEFVTNLGSDFLNQLPCPLKKRIAQVIINGYELRMDLGEDISHEIANIIAAASVKQKSEMIERMVNQIETMLANRDNCIACIRQLQQNIFSQPE